MATACVFCGASGTMTKEHVLPDWLERIGLTGQPAAAGSGWLNRSSEYRQTSRPFQTTVKAVCATCNNGWMNQLEQIAGRVLAPIIRGEDTTGDLFQLAHPAVVAGRADRLDRCLERPAGLAVLTRPVQPPLSLIHISEPTRRTPISY